MANRPITTDRRGEWDILLNCIKKSPAMPGFSFVYEWQEKRFRTGRAVFSEWHVCFRFWCRFLCLGMAAAWRVSGLTKFPGRGCFKPVCFCRGCFDRPVRNVCISKNGIELHFVELDAAGFSVPEPVSRFSFRVCRAACCSSV